MEKFSRSVCIVILGCLLVIGILYAKAPTASVKSKPKVLVEAMVMQVSGDALGKLQIGRNRVPSSKVTVPLATLLYVLADPNAVKVIAKQELLVWAGQTGMVSTGEKVKFLVKKEGRLEEKTTDTPIGTTLQATPVIDEDGDIMLNFKFEHCFIIDPPKEIDPQTSLPIGPPMTSSGLVNTRLKLKSGEPMIAGGMETPGAQVFIIVRAEILERPAGPE